MKPFKDMKRSKTGEKRALYNSRAKIHSERRPALKCPTIKGARALRKVVDAELCPTGQELAMVRTG